MNSRRDSNLSNFVYFVYQKCIDLKIFEITVERIKANIS